MYELMWDIVFFTELLLTSYDKNVDSVHDPDGICLVWNTRFKKTTPGKSSDNNYFKRSIYINEFY